VWRSTTPLPSARAYGCAVALDNFVYYLSGATGSGELVDTLVAPVESDGTLGAWTATTPLPAAAVWAGCAVDPATRAVVIAGGNTPDQSVAIASAWTATIAADGTIGAWSALPDLPGPRRGLAGVFSGGTFYMLGGEAGEGFQVQATVFALQEGAPGSWLTETPLPAASYVFGAAIAAGTVVVTGGYETDSDVWSSSPGASFGSAAPLSEPRERHASVAIGSDVYVIGGEADFGATPYSDAMRVRVDSTGALGAWETLAPLPVPIAYETAATTNGRIYVLGGTTDNASSYDGVAVLAPPP
jgi:non-specific serine/threonine protein kinase